MPARSWRTKRSIDQGNSSVAQVATESHDGAAKSDVLVRLANRPMAKTILGAALLAVAGCAIPMQSGVSHVGPTAGPGSGAGVGLAGSNMGIASSSTGDGMSLVGQRGAGSETPGKARLADGPVEAVGLETGQRSVTGGGRGGSANKSVVQKANGSTGSASVGGGGRPSSMDAPIVRPKNAQKGAPSLVKGDQGKSDQVLSSNDRLTAEAYEKVAAQLDDVLRSPVGRPRDEQTSVAGKARQVADASILNQSHPLSRQLGKIVPVEPLPGTVAPGVVDGRASGMVEVEFTPTDVMQSSGARGSATGVKGQPLFRVPDEAVFAPNSGGPNVGGPNPAEALTDARNSVVARAEPTKMPAISASETKAATQPAAPASQSTASQPVLAEPTSSEADAGMSFRVSKALLARRIEGFGRYMSMESALPQGRVNPVLIYTEVDGFAHATPMGNPIPRGGPDAGGASSVGSGNEFVSSLEPSPEWVVAISQEVRLLSAEGNIEKLHIPEQTARDISKSRRRDHYLVQRVDLPATLEPGQYVLKITVRDKASSAQAEQTIPISIVRRTAMR